MLKYTGHDTKINLSIVLTYFLIPSNWNSIFLIYILDIYYDVLLINKAAVSLYGCVLDIATDEPCHSHTVDTFISQVNIYIEKCAL